MLNQITLLGRLTKDVELRKTPNDTSVASFTIAVDRDFQSGGSERQADFIPVVAWKNNAEFVSKWFSKGSLICLSGSLQMRNWEDKQGNKRVTAEVLMERCWFAGSKSEKATQNPAADFTELPDEEDLPF